MTTSPSLGRLLISHITLRGPELGQLYDLVAGRPDISYAELAAALTPAGASRDAFGLAEAPMAEALNFLLAAGLVAQDGPARRRASFVATPLLAGAPFTLLLLHHIQSHCEERQRAPALMYRELVAADALALTAAAIREQMERGALRSLFAWTGEKVTFWTHLAHYLGLVRRLDRSQEVLVVPQPRLVLDTLRWAARDATAAPLPASAALDTIDRIFFACYTGRGRVHRGLAQALAVLERSGSLRVAHSADAARSLMLGDRRVSELYLNATGGGL